jgi:hypothetical protein
MCTCRAVCPHSSPFVTSCKGSSLSLLQTIPVCVCACVFVQHVWNVSRELRAVGSCVKITHLASCHIKTYFGPNSDKICSAQLYDIWLGDPQSKQVNYQAFISWQGKNKLISCSVFAHTHTLDKNGSFKWSVGNRIPSHAKGLETMT